MSPLPMSRPDWFDEAACRDLGPAQFHPDAKDALTRRRAIAVCWGCPVRVDCLEHSLANREPDGIWGGLSISARNRLLAERGQPRLSWARHELPSRCPAGHLYDAANTGRTSLGHRRCKACVRARLKPAEVEGR